MDLHQNPEPRSVSPAIRGLSLDRGSAMSVLIEYYSKKRSVFVESVSVMHGPKSKKQERVCCALEACRRSPLND